MGAVRNGIGFEISDAVPVATGDTYDKLRWGSYQFPCLRFTESGSVYLNWAMSADTVDDYTGAK